MSTIKVQTSRVRDAASSSRAASTRLVQATGQLTSAVAPALRGDVPEYGQIESAYTALLAGMRASSNSLADGAANLAAYAALADMTERANEALIGRLQDLFGAIGRTHAEDGHDSDWELPTIKGAPGMGLDLADGFFGIKTSSWLAQRPLAPVQSVTMDWGNGASFTSFRGASSTSFTGTTPEAFQAYLRRGTWLETGSKFARGGSFVLSSGIGGWEQWNHDAGQGYSKPARGTRAVTVGVSTAGGAVAGGAAFGGLASMAGYGAVLVVVPGVGEVAILVVGASLIGGYVGAHYGKQIGQALANGTGKLADGTVWVVTGTAHGISTAAGAAASGTKSAASAVAGTAQNAGGAVKAGTVHAAHAAKNTAEEAGGAVKAGTVHAAHAAKNTAVSIGGNIGDGAAHGAHAVGSKATKVVGAVASWHVF